MKKTFWGTTIILLLSLFCYFNFWVYPTPENFPFHLNEQPILIAHGGGAIDGQTYTNSKEAIINALNNNYNFIEIDFHILDDNKLAGIHDLKSFNEATGYGSTNQSISSSEFKNRKIHGYLTPVLGEDIAQIFKQNSAYLITDKITDPEILEKEIPIEKDRIFVEVPTYKEYRSFLKKGYKYPMLTIYELHVLKHYWPLFSTGKIKALVIPTILIDKHPEELKLLLEKDITIFAHTSDDKEYIKENIGKTVSGFYTDSTTNLK